MNFTSLSDKELLDYVKQPVLINALDKLTDSQLLSLHFELTQVPSRKPLPVPFKIVATIQSRGLNKPEQRELYGEYKRGK
jgi:hypothetical protein